MGLPEIIIEFKTKGVTAIKRSARGIVAIVLKDDTEERAGCGSHPLHGAQLRVPEAGL